MRLDEIGLDWMRLDEIGWNRKAVKHGLLQNFCGSPSEHMGFTAAQPHNFRTHERVLNGPSSLRADDQMLRGS